MSTKFTDPKIIAIELGLDKGSEPVPKPKTDEQLHERCKQFYRKLGRDRMLRQGDPVEDIATFVQTEIAAAPIGDALAERICRALIVHAFENDAAMEKLIMSHKDLIAEMKP